MLDEEMRARAAAHQQERGRDFTTIEEPLDLAGRIAEICAAYPAVVVDCLTLWISNMMHAGRDLPREVGAVLRAASESPATVILVTNEVGCGIVPENELARRFRDAAGAVNQQAATAATEVYWMAFGIPMRLK